MQFSCTFSCLGGGGGEGGNGGGEGSNGGGGGGSDGGGGGNGGGGGGSDGGGGGNGVGGGGSGGDVINHEAFKTRTTITQTTHSTLHQTPTKNTKKKSFIPQKHPKQKYPPPPPVLEDGGESGEEVFDGWSHLGHAYDVDDGLESSEDAAEHLGILFPQVLVQHHPQVTHQLLLMGGGGGGWVEQEGNGKDGGGS